MTGDDESEIFNAAASESPTASDHTRNGASWAGGWGTEPPAAAVEKIISDSGARENHHRDRRVVARGVPRREVDEGLLIQALLMIAKDSERGDVSRQGLSSGD
ncbi:hypothetical protein ABH935_003244 [Catenulispora sp. GAS73]|uniref:hypothetical protein n=1 Tax=Catenulispora sp. GAS73 TaxID=3156269 RepID=UPI00351553CA